MKILVTGNLGYVGTVMTPLLSEQEFEVWGIDTGYYRDCLLGPVERTGVARQLHKDLRDVTVDDLHRDVGDRLAGGEGYRAGPLFGRHGRTVGPADVE